MSRLGTALTPPLVDPGRGSAAPVWIWGVAAVALTKALVSIGHLDGGERLGLALWIVFALHVAVFSAAGLALLLLGRSDRRAELLGLFFLLVGMAFADSMLPGETGSPTVEVLRHLRMDALGPFLLWLFIRDFPKRVDIFRGSSAADWFAGASLLVGVTLMAGNLLPLLLPASEAAARLFSWVHGGSAASVYWPLVFLSMLPAVPYAAWRARQAAPDERRRVHLLLWGLALGLAPDLLVTFLAAASPTFERFAFTPTGRLAVGAAVYPALLSIPLTTAYAVLVQKALDVRLVLRKAVQYALARTTLASLLTLPFVAALLLLYLRRRESIIELGSGTPGLLLAGALVVGGGAMWLRPRLLVLVDRRFFREQYDAQVVLSALVERIRALRSREELAEVLAREIDVALHLRLAELLLLDYAAGALVSVRGAVRPLPLDSALARSLAGAPAPLDVDWARLTPWLAALPDAEQHWVADTAARLLIPILGADGRVVGLMVLGEKFSELPFSAEDRLLLKAIAGSVSLVIESRGFDRAAAGTWTSDAAVAADVPAQECTGCGEIVRGGSARCELCGGPTAPAAVPELLTGKFLMLRRAGQGGMGVIYRAVDLSLEREVAVKTLPRMAAGDAARLRREARTMAAVQHQNLALIFGAESWQGIPMLVVEFLPDGTLADRLHRGPLPLDEALRLGIALASALERLHGAGILHRDIKPSNIGFTADGSPKLLDFGISQFLEGARPPPGPAAGWTAEEHAPLVSFVGRPGEIAGTIAYLSPEAAQGAPPQPSWDVWSLAMVLYEAIAGRHPFAGGSSHWILLRIAEAAVPDVRELAPTVPEGVASFFREALAGDPKRRPASGRDLLFRLQGLARSLEREPALPRSSLV